MFCRIAGVTAAALLISGAVWAQTGGSGSSSSSGQSTTPDSGSGTQAPGTDQSGASSPGSSSGSTMSGSGQSGTDTQSGTTTGTQSGTTDTTQTTTTTTTQTSTGTSGTDENRTRLELSAFAGYAFNQTLNLNSNIASGSQTTNFYDRIGPRDRFTDGASLGYDVTRNLMVGVLWSGQNNDKLQVSNFNSTAATAVGFTRTGAGTGTVGTGTGTGTGGTGTGTTGTGTGTVTNRVGEFPILGTANGASNFQIGTMNVNNFHGIIGYEFGPDTALIRPFVYGGAGVTRYGDVNFSYSNQVTSGTGRTATTSSQMVSAVLPSLSRFSTTWGIGLQIAPYKGLGIRIVGRWTPTRLSNSSFTGPAAFTSTAGAGTGATGTTGTGTTGTGTTGTGTTGTGTGTTGTGATGAATGANGAANGINITNSNSAWWCNAFSGCSTKSSLYQNQWAITGGITVRF